LLIATPKADDRQIPFNSSQAKQKRAGCAMSFLMAVQCGKLFVPASTCMIFAFHVILQAHAMKTVAQFSMNSPLSQTARDLKEFVSSTHSTRNCGT
jgi:hypothetical protein